MASTTDILLRIRAQDSTGSAFKSVESKANSMKNMVSGAVGMAAGMIGYDMINALADSGREAINASQNLDYFAGRLKLSADTTNKFKNDINQMQTQFRKVDMTAVGASAEEIIMKSNGAIAATSENLHNVTEMTATMSSAFVKEGRTQEDAILAVNDALGGQFKRLQELNITEDMLKNNGWSGEISDQTTLIDALNKTMDDMGYKRTAQDIVTLDDAWQALSVSGGRLLADIIVPLTPAFLGITDGILVAVDGIRNFVSMLQGIFSGMPDWALIAGGVVVLGTTFALVGTIIMTTYVPGMVASVISTINWIATALGAEVSAITLSGAFGLLGTTIWAALAPLLPFIAAAALLAVAVYEVGKYFGWWKDVGSMIDAISDGVRRLWEAFINSPQVQGAIKAVQSALTDLWNYLQPFIGWLQTQWANIFGSAGSNPDAVRMIWQAFQTLGDIASAVFPYIQQGFQTIMYVVQPLVDMIGNLVGIFGALASGSISWQDAIMQAFNAIWTGITTYQTRLGQIALQIGSRIFNGIMSYARRIPGMLWTLLSQAGQRILAFGNTAAARARNAGMRILNAIINYIRQLPGRVYTFMMQVPGRIASAASAAVGAAASLASQVVQAVTNGVVGVADAVYNEFIQIGSKINESVSSAVSAAASFGSDIKSAVLNALGIASPGIIQRKIAIEFADIPGRIGDSNDYVYSAARDYAGNIMRGFNAPQMSFASMGAVRDNTSYNPSAMRGGNTTIIYVQPGAIPVDARNMTEREAVNVVTAAFESLFPGGA